MKIKIVLVFLLFPFFAAAQSADPIMDSLAKNVFDDLLDSWTLGIDSNNEDIDIRVYNKFKSLFDSNAVVEDDINIGWTFNFPGPYIMDTVPKSFEVFAHDVALQVKGIAIDLDSASIVSTVSSAGHYTYTLSRNVYVQKTREYVIAGSKDFIATKVNSRKGSIDFERQRDSLEMDAVFNKKLFDSRNAVYKFKSGQQLKIELGYSKTEGIFKIISIKDITKNAFVVCTIDRDWDGILDEEDSLPTRAGEFTANGMPDFDFDGVPDPYKDERGKEINLPGWDKCVKTYGWIANEGCPGSYFSTKKQSAGFIGIQFNSANIILPELNKLGYRDAAGNDVLDVLQSKRGRISYPNTVVGFYAGGNFTYYFGAKRKRTGLSVGFTYSDFTVPYTLTEPMVYTFKATDGVNFYRRQVTVSSLREDIRYSAFNFPLMFNYRSHLGRQGKVTFNVKAGPSFLLFSNASTYDANIDFGGLFQVDSGRAAAGIVYYDHFSPGSSWNVLVTSAGINAQNNNPGADSVFSQLFTNSSLYDFAANKNYRGKTKLTRATVAFNFVLDFQKQINRQVSVKFGVNLLYAPLLERSEKYKSVDKTTDAYNSIYNSSSKTNYRALGLSVGLAYDF